MKTLVYAPSLPHITPLIAGWLDSFGKGLHVSAVSVIDDSIATQHWSFAIFIDTDSTPVPIMASHTISIPAHDKYSALKDELYVIFRDHLADMRGGKCSCGLYDICHCH